MYIYIYVCVHVYVYIYFVRPWGLKKCAPVDHWVLICARAAIMANYY